MGEVAFLLVIPVRFVLVETWVGIGSILWISGSVSTGS